MLQLPVEEPRSALPPATETSLPAPSRPRLQLEFGGGHGLGFGKMYAVAPAVATAIGAPTRFQNYGTSTADHLELYLFELDLNLRIGEFFRVGVRASNLTISSFVNPGEALARVSFEAPPGIPLRYDGAHFSVVPVLWLGTGYAVADSASEPQWAWRPGLALDVSGALEFRWKHAFLLAEVGYRALWSWRQEAGGESESAPVRFSSPAFSDGVRVGIGVGARFQAF